MFNIVEKKKIFITVSALVIVAGLIAFFAMGFNADIDFTGGYTMSVKVVTEGDADLNEAKPEAETKDEESQTVETKEDGAEADEDNGLIKTQLVVSEKTAPLKTYEFSEDEIRKIIGGVDNGVVGAKISSVVKSDDGFVIKTNELDEKQASDVKQALADKFGAIKVISEDKVSATVGSELLGSSLQALLIAAVLMLIYISYRFELLSGLAAVMALVHDVLIMLAFYAIFRIPVNTSFIAAMLTIIGYSINATIVIFDRIRENTKFLKKETFADIVNKSIWQSMGRSINTSVTTLLTIVMVYILGVTSVREFALPIIIGVVCGAYSSVFLSGSFWCLLMGKKANEKAKLK